MRPTPTHPPTTASATPNHGTKRAHPGPTAHPSGRHQHPARSAAYAIAVVLALGTLIALPMPAEAQTAGKITGLVTDGDGQPLGKVDVMAAKGVAGDLSEVKRTTTDAEGIYTIENASSGTWTVTFTRDGYTKREPTVEVKAGETATLDVTMQSTSAQRSETKLTAKTVDAETNEPISGALVTLTSWTNTGRVRDKTTTDANGTFSIQLYVGENQVEITKRGYRTHHLWTSPEQEATSDRAPIKMQPVPIQTSGIKGKVIDANTGKALQAWVELSIDWESFERQQAHCYGEPEPAPAKDDAATSDEKMIAPCEPYDSYGRYNSSASKTDGTFEMKAYAGDYNVHVNRVDYGIFRTKVTLTEGNMQTLEVKLKPLPAKDVTLSGRVTDAKTGGPIANAQVNAQVSAWGDYEWAQTDKDGRFTLKLRPGHTILSAHVWDHGGDVVIMETTAESESSTGSSSSASGSTASDTSMPAPAQRAYYGRNIVLTTTAGETRSLDVKMTPKPEPKTTVIGYVVDDATKKGIPGVHVSYQNQATGDWGNAKTDDTGSFKFLVRGGYSTFHVWHDGYHPTVQDLEVPATGQVRQDLFLSPGESSGSGWWDPNQQYGDHGYGYAEEAAVDDSDGGAKRGASSPLFARADSAESSSDSIAGSSRDGQQVNGGGGGLPPYDPNATDDTFGGEGPVPAPGLLVSAMLIGLAAIVIGTRRER